MLSSTSDNYYSTSLVMFHVCVLLVYKYFMYQTLTWQDAEDFCIEDGGHLVSIEDESEYQIVYDFAFNTDSTFVCAKSRNLSAVKFFMCQIPMHFRSTGGISDV